MTSATQAQHPGVRTEESKRLRIGFAGVGWIGRNRMKAILARDSCEVAGIVEPSEELAQSARELTRPDAAICSYEELLRSKPDGIVIATPNSLHAQQAVAALKNGVAVFCQKPIGRNLQETQQVIDAARTADRLFHADFCYRFVRGVTQIRELVRTGALGRVFATEFVFHNAYGPDKPWFYDPVRSGGGCLIDLGIHLVDLALWILDFPKLRGISGNLFSAGSRFRRSETYVEDYATAKLQFENDSVATIACSWKSHLGRNAAIEVAAFGGHGGARLRNVDGSFFDFVTESFRGTQSEILSEPPEEWGGRAALEWISQLERNNHFDPRAEQYAASAAILDRIYGL
ncbi:MAG TPA: Gfo/Idh/MocA family oxidoreductase [Candidatus Acidoferrales bacterium]|nr:Gfo/Idh/MocA family oxidoreductase [Candidatus Acidoferrales bacterium]